MDGPLFTLLLGMALNKLLKFLLNMDPMFIFKIQFFDFLIFICGFHCWVCFMLIVNGCVVWYFFCFCSFFLTTFFLLKYGGTALHLAALRGFEQIVKILLKHGSNVDLQKKVLIFFFFLIFFFISLFFWFLYLLIVIL